MIMKLYREKDECLATDIIERHGFTCLNPAISLVTSKIWEKDGKQYKFTGWENTPKTVIMAENPKFVNMELI